MVVAKTIKQKKLEGNKAKVAKSKLEVAFASHRKANKKPPTQISKYKYAVEEWNRLYNFVSDLGILHVGTKHSFVVYCKAFHDWVEACESCIDQDRVVVSESGNYKINPAYQHKKEIQIEFRKAIADFGLRPIDLETKVPLAGLNEEDDEVLSEPEDFSDL